MLNPSATREQRFRKTKAQLIDEIISLENAFLRSKPPNRSGAPAEEVIPPCYALGYRLSK